MKGILDIYRKHKIKFRFIDIQILRLYVAIFFNSSLILGHSYK